MATASLRYMSPRSVAAMSRLDNTIIPVHEDPPTEPLLAASVADMQTVTSSNQRTKNQFRPRAGKGGATSYQLRQYAEVTLGGGSLRKAVKLPEGEDENEWLAVNSESSRFSWREAKTDPARVPVVDFYNQINLLYGAITEFCSPQSCPEMKATDEYDDSRSSGALG